MRTTATTANSSCERFRSSPSSCASGRRSSSWTRTRRRRGLESRGERAMQGQRQRLIIIGVAFVAILGLFAFLAYSQLKDLDRINADKAKLEGEMKLLDDKIATKQTLINERDAAASVFDELVEFLPSEDEYATRSRILSLVSEFALKTGAGF